MGDPTPVTNCKTPTCSALTRNNSVRPELGNGVKTTGGRRGDQSCDSVRLGIAWCSNGK